jgi:hypothetical protein
MSSSIKLGQAASSLKAGKMCHFDNYSSTLVTVPGALEWAVLVIYHAIKATLELRDLLQGVSKLWSIGKSGLQLFM